MTAPTDSIYIRSALKDLVDAAQRIGSIADQLPLVTARSGVSNTYTNGHLHTDTDSVAEAASAAGINLTPAQRLICERVINVFETGSIQGDYAAISIFEDGPNDIRQITYGRSQTTEYGNLPELVKMYVEAGGMFSEDLRPFVPLVGRTALVDNDRFKTLLRKAGAQDPVMRSTQDVFFDRRYFQPAIQWASNNGFTEALSALVIYDSFIHSGQILPLLRSRFPEVPPAQGGNERTWISSYVGVRDNWLRHHSRPAVRASAYRTHDLLREIGRGNWDLGQLPIMAHGVAVNANDGGMAEKLVADDIPYLGPSGTAYADGGGTYGDTVDEIWGDDTFAATAAAQALAAAPGDAASLATQLRDNARVALATEHVSGVVDHANAHQNIIDMAAGGPARRSHYGNAPGGTVMLDRRLLKGMTTLAQDYTYSVAEICGGSHNPNSRHYAGLAADFNVINGRGVSASHPDVSAFKARCRALGATEVLGPGNPNHDTHVHAAWPRP